MSFFGVYPSLRILLGFFIVPGLAGFCFGLFFIFYLVFAGVGERVVFLWMIPIISGVGGSIFYGVPAFLLSLLYLWMRLYKEWQSCLFVFLCGGGGGVLWGWGVRNIGGLSSFPYFLGLTDPMVFLSGAFFSLCVALWVLPKKRK
jgi:hypothetical protein